METYLLVRWPESQNLMEMDWFDEEKLVPQSNYFRVFQNFPLAWYYTYNLKQNNNEII